MRSHSPARAALWLGLLLSAAGCENTGAECGPGTVEIDGVCVPSADPDDGVAPDMPAPPPLTCPEGTIDLDLDGDGVPEECLPEPVVGDCDAPPLLEGPILRDTVLAPGGCFRVEGELAVTGGALLALSEGVDIDFAANAALTVDGGYLASLGTADAPVRLHGGDAAGHWQGVRFAAASAVALEPPPPPQAIAVELPDGSTFAPTIIDEARSVAAFYDYRSASAHTGFEAVDRGLLALHRDAGTGALSLVAIFGADTPEQPKTAVRLSLDGVPDGAQIVVQDDPDNRVTRDGAAIDARFGFARNTDGLALGPLPADADWAITVELTDNRGVPPEEGGDGDGITEWVFMAPDGSTTALPLDGVITVRGTVEAVEPQPILGGRDTFNRLRGVVIEHAAAGLTLGANDVGVRVEDAAFLRNTVGVDSTAPGAQLQLSRTILGESVDAAARITAWQLDAFDGTNRFEGGRPDVFVRGGALSADRSVPPTAPTVFLDTLQVTGGATLTAPAGVDMVFGNKATLLLDGGRLVARGDGDRTRLRGAARAPGYWTGVRITNGGALELDGVDLTDAGADAGDGAPAAVRVIGPGEAWFIDSTVTDHAGLSLDAPAASRVGARGATFAAGGRIGGDQLGAFDEGTRFGDIVAVSAGAWAREGQLVPGVPYRIDGVVEMRPGSRLDAGPGVALTFADDAGLAVRGDGLRFIGSSDDPVALSGDAWRGIAFFGGGAERNVLEQVRFAGAGQTEWRAARRGAVSVLGADVRLKICAVDYGDAPRGVDLAFEADIIDCDDTDPCEDGGPVELCGADPLPVSCGAGTEEVVAEDGSLECRPDAAACEDGEAFDPALRRCRAVEGGEVRCGEGTEQVDGECRPIDGGPAVVCGDGTEEVIIDDRVECRPDATACEDGEAYDAELRRCRAIGPAMLVCGAGTEEVDGECRPVADNLICGDGTVRVDNACLPSICGDGIVDADNAEECDGGADCNRFCRSVADAECLDDEDCGDGAVCDLGQLACVGGGAVFGPCEGPAVEFTPLVHPIAAETTLVAGNCYFVPADTVVEDATLNIQAGVELRFAADAALVFQGASVLNAQGTPDAPIVFDGVEPRPGYWQGVAFNVAGEALPGSVLRHVHLLNAGGQTFDANIQRYQRIFGPYAIAALLVSGPVPALDAEGLRIERSEAVGLSVRPTEDEAPALRFADSVFIANAIDAALPAQEADVFVAPFAFNGQVEVFGSIAQSTTYRAGVPYRFTQQAHATNGARVVVEPGALLRFEPDTSLSFGDATLIADARGFEPILFDSTTPDTRWIGVGLQGGQGHVLRNVTIRRAGGEDFNQNIQRFPRVTSAVAANLVISGPTVEATIADVRLIDGDGIGLQITDHDADFGAGLSGLVVEGNAEGGAQVEPSGMGALLADGQWGADQTVQVFGRGEDDQDIIQDLIIHRGVPFEVQEPIAINNGAHVQVQPGAAMRFVPNAGIVVDGGSLEARGRPDAGIVFESTNEEPWRGISFFQNTLSDRNVLRHVRLDHAGAGFNENLLGVPRVFNSDGAISVASDTARVELGELSITNYPVYGIRSDEPGAQLGGTLGRSRFESPVGAAALRLHANHASMIGPYVHFEPAPQGDNPQAPAAWVDVFGEITRDTTMGPNVFWRVIDHLHVTTGATLSVLAGARVTFDETKGALMNGGFMRVLGTEEAPVTFTSRFADPPFEDPGRWRGIGFFQNTDGDRNLLRHLVVEHAGDSSWDVSLESTPRIRGAERSAIDLISDTVRVRMHDVTLREGSGVGIHSEAAYRVDDCHNVNIEYPEERQIEGVIDDRPDTLRDLCRWAGPFPADSIEAAQPVAMSPVPRRGTLGGGPDDRWFRFDPPGPGAVLVDIETGRTDQRVQIERVVQYGSVEEAEADPDAGRVIFDRDFVENDPRRLAFGPGRTGYRFPVFLAPDDDDVIRERGGPVYVELSTAARGYVDYRITFDRTVFGAECSADLDCDFAEVCFAGECVDAVAEGLDEPNEGAGEPMRSHSSEGGRLRNLIRGTVTFDDVAVTTVGPVDVDPVDRYAVRINPARRHLTVLINGNTADFELSLRAADGALIEPQSAQRSEPDGRSILATWLNLAPGRYTLEVGATDFRSSVTYGLFAEHDSRPWLDCRFEPQSCFNACGGNFNRLVIESLGGTGEMPGADVCAVRVTPGAVRQREAVFGPGEVCVNARREPLCEAVVDDPGLIGAADPDCASVLPLGRGGRFYAQPSRGFAFPREGEPPTATITTANERTAENDGYDVAACNFDETCCVYVGRHRPAEDADAPDTIEWAIPANPEIIDAGEPEFE